MLQVLLKSAINTQQTSDSVNSDPNQKPYEVSLTTTTERSSSMRPTLPSDWGRNKIVNPTTGPLLEEFFVVTTFEPNLNDLSVEILTEIVKKEIKEVEEKVIETNSSSSSLLLSNIIFTLALFFL